ncbi:MAG: DUF3006 domain-containing protein [Synergistaceae bacterium]|nr:DUF3006 domain-containing protein [Synergistaceae bacterium]
MGKIAQTRGGKVFFFIDAINGGVAALLTESGEQRFDISALALPEGLGEGDWVSASFEPAREKKNEVGGEIDDLYGELGDYP